MKKTFIIIIYFFCLLIFSFIVTAIPVINFEIPVLNDKLLLTPMLFATILGGMLCLYHTSPLRAFKVFLTIYCALWLLRMMMMASANAIGQIHIGNKIVNFDFVVSNYYKYMSRLDGPLPFVIFWLIEKLSDVLEHLQPKETASKNDRNL